MGHPVTETSKAEESELPKEFFVALTHLRKGFRNTSDEEILVEQRLI